MGRSWLLLRKHLAVGLHGAAIIAGWAFLTWGLASLLVWQVWPLSLGFLLLSLAGWGHLRELFAAGLYFLTRSRE